MAMIDDIRRRFVSDQFEFSKHAVDRMLLRHISVQEVRQAIRAGEVIEDYPQDKYGPSCLVYGATRAKRPLHVQCSYPTRPIIQIVTVYEPNPNEWIDFKQRKT